MNPNDFTASLRCLTPEERAELDRLLTAGTPAWLPQPGPQRDALESDADELFYGGAAGGGKTDLLIGAALTRHRRALICRRKANELVEIARRAEEIVGHRKGYNANRHAWRRPGGRCEWLEFGHCQHPGDERAYQGRPHDLKAFDEITHFLKAQYQYLIGWNRTRDPAQRCRVICAGNPPTEAAGDWVIEHWAPWLDPAHPNPARPGELRWFAVLDGESREVESGAGFAHKGETVWPRSRSFIPSAVDDNVYYRTTGYKATLQALPEPLRSKMLKGDFTADRAEDPWQVIPTAWVEQAQARWQDRAPEPMTTLGVDPARGGADETVVSPRHGSWFAAQIVRPGKATPDGPSVAALVVAAMRDRAQANIDAVGIGASVYDHLKGNGVACRSLVASERSLARDRTGALGFVNKRAEWWWAMREALDPDYGEAVALPPDLRLRADLCAPRWKLAARGIQVEAKEDIVARIGRSPDRGDAAVLALVARTPRLDGPLSAAPRGDSSWMGM